MARRVPVPLRDRLDDLRHGPAIFLVWLAAAAGVGWLMLRRTDAFEYTGLARARDHVVAAPAAGSLEALNVEIYQDVRRGAPVGRLDGREVEARLATAHEEIERLSSEVAAERARLELARGESEATRRLAERRLVLDEEERVLDALELEVRLTADRIGLERLDLRAERLRALSESRIVAVEELEDLLLRREELARQIAGNQALLTELRRARVAADTRRTSYEDERPPTGLDVRQLEPLRRAVLVQEARVKELGLERQRLVLTAPVTGRVSSVLAGPGATLSLGQPVVVVTERVPTEVVAYQPESDRRPVAEGEGAWIARLDGSEGRSEGLVVRLAPSVEELPERLWRDPARPEYGRPFLIPVAEELGLTPGERVGVWLDR